MRLSMEFLGMKQLLCKLIGRKASVVIREMNRARPQFAKHVMRLKTKIQIVSHRSRFVFEENNKCRHRLKMIRFIWLISVSLVDVSLIRMNNLRLFDYALCG